MKVGKFSNGFKGVRCNCQLRIEEFAKNAKNGQLSDFTIFRNFEPELYMLWSFGKATV